MNTLPLPFSIVSFLLAAASLLGTTAARAQSGTPQSPYVITSAPTVITRAGYYILGNNVSSAQTSGNIIDIQASNVTLDLNGFYVSGPVGNTSQNTRGIYALERNNITVKNGTVANVSIGVLLDANSSSTTNNLNDVLDQLRVSRCSYRGIALYYTTSCSVTNCKLSFIGTNGDSGASAIYVSGPGVTAQGCGISRGLGTGSIGIDSDAGSFARQNTISNYTYGVDRGTYQDNLTSGCTTPFINGNNAGGNY